MLKPGSDPDDGDEALKYYANHTAQIEVTIYIVSWMGPTVKRYVYFLFQTIFMIVS